MTPLAIVGIGSMFPDAENSQQFWTNIKTGVDSIREVPASHWRADDYFDADPKTRDKVYAKLGGFLSPVRFNPMDYGILPNALEAIDTSQLLGLLAVEQALQDAGYGAGKEYHRERVSVILGVTGTLELVVPLGARLGYPRWKQALAEAGVDEETAADVMDRISDSYVPWQENSFPGLLGNVVAGRISKHFNFGGTNCVVDAACGSSLSALNLAALELAAGRSDMVITGGVDTFNDIFMYTCFSKTPALSPSGHAKPYSDNADGTTLGEGLGVVVIKRLADAERDGDRIYAVIKGIGASSDGRGSAIYEPSAQGQTRALLRAYQQAQVSPATIELVEGHGTGTKVGDAIEVNALRQVYGTAQQPWCALGSIKSQIGHTKAAAGAAGLIKAALALYHKVLPPTIKVQQPASVLLEKDSPFYVNTECRPWFPAGNHPRRAAVSALGFGGSNFHCLVEEYTEEKNEVDWTGDVQILPFSADDKATLKHQLQAFPHDAQWQQLRLLVAQRRLDFDRQARCRLVMVIERGTLSEPLDIGRRIDAAVAVLDQPKEGWHETPDGIYLSTDEPADNIAFLYPGQGAQYPGMLKTLALQFPEFQRVVNEADQVFAEKAQVPRRTLTDLIYPRPVYSSEQQEAAVTALRATEVAQPVLGAMECAGTAVLQRFGLSPQAAAGHSYGELVALCHAGVFSAADLHRLSRLRGELMAAKGSERGTMLAVSAPLDAISKFIQSEHLDLVLANRNTPEQGVLSGSHAEIERARAALAGQGVSCAPLSVAAAFHSPLVATAAQPFAQALETTTLTAPAFPVYANTSGDRYPQDVGELRSLLARQLASPVDFVTEIEAMYRDGLRIFVEVGPGARLSGMVRTILKGKDIQTLALDSSNGKRCALVDLARLLAKLAALGVTVALTSWDENVLEQAAQQPVRKKGLTVTLTGANHFNKPQPRPPRQQKMAGKSVIPSSQPQEQQEEIPMPDQQVRPPVTTTSQARPAPVPDSGLSAALRLSQQNIEALQSISQQTAKLHQQFLEGQQAATRSFMQLVEQQRQLLGGRAITPAVPVAIAEAVPSIATPPVAEQPAPSELTPPPVTADPVADPSPISGTPASHITSALLAVIAEKTGYPVEMLELGMSLDADLGIDSIKRVEILSALQERLPELPAVKPEDLGVLQTLGQIVDHLQQGAAGTVTGPGSSGAAADAGADTGKVTSALLAVIAEKTGYPVEMLELGMSLDADLGIDSIKRVEILSALQERLPELPAVKPEDLGVLQTLGQIVEHLQQGTAGMAKTAGMTVSTGVAGPQVTTALLAVIAEKTGYPVEMLELGMSLDADLGIDSIKRVEILSALQERLPALPVVKPEHLGTLQTIDQIVDFLSSVSGSEKAALTLPDRESEPLPIIKRQEVCLASLPKKRPVKSFSFGAGAQVWITDDGSALIDALATALTRHNLIARKVKLTDITTLDAPANLCGLLIVAPLKGCNDHFIAESFQLLQLAAPQLRKQGTGQGAFFATISRLNGSFGLPARSGFGDPLSGGLAGLSKTAALEWPEVHCKALDLGLGMEVVPAATTLVEEIFTTTPLEIGVSSTGLTTLELVSEDVTVDTRELALEEGDLVVVSGGARGVTAAVSVALARKYRPTLALLGRSPLPADEPDWLKGLDTEAEIKKAVLAHTDNPPAPKELQQQYDQILAGREIRSTLDDILKAGATPLYLPVDLRDEQAVTATINNLQEQYGAVKGVIHGAGVLADKLIVDKSREQFAAVYDTKVRGCRHLLAAINVDQLAFLVMFSSSTARFGRIGQADYAIANEVLNKIAQQFAQSHPETRVLSMNWGPWDGGMVNAALKKMFAREGIEVIDLQAGAAYLLKELTATDKTVELVIAGGHAQDAVTEEPEPAQNLYLSSAFDLDLNIDQFPLLKSHVIDGKAVVPAALMVEWLAHAAVHNHPGLKFQGFNDFRVLKGIILEAGQTYNLQAMTGKAIKSDGLHVVPVELSGHDERGRAVAHARARVVLAAGYNPARQARSRLDLETYAQASAGIYADQKLFHGEAFQGLREILGCSTQGINALVSPAPQPQQWIEQPLRNSWFADPLALDSSFQIMILWSFDQYQAGSLPVFAGRYRQYRERFPADGVEVRARIISNSPHRATADIDFVDPNDGQLVARLENYECVIDASLNATFQRNKLTGVA
ncbi:SDR family oxidoreductase [Pelobacter sp. M08fum]|uniref:SDR family oxidoreductase n=2 Tax=Pelovirga terrestris TaxID=2771352 RepID=A0A8J6UG48_9BACT|nr:type I polyketide synthase [Pelovirga terrestris]MBD1399133.1 SDR family oxidoreductase [Pelovirga terrestris]